MDPLGRKIGGGAGTTGSTRQENRGGAGIRWG